LNGCSLYPEPEVWVGEALAGKEAVAVFRLRNLLTETVTVVGARADCGCSATEDLPLAVPPRALSEMRLRFRTRSGDEGRLLQYGVLLYLDTDSAPVYLKTRIRVPAPNASTAKGGRGGN
jgi:hypothetical protein